MLYYFYFFFLKNEERERNKFYKYLRENLERKREKFAIYLFYYFFSLCSWTEERKEERLCPRAVAFF